MAPSARSLRSRLLLALAALLLVAAAVAVFSLDALYRNLGLRAQQEVLDAQVIALISTAEIEADGRLVPQNLAEPRLATPGSGLYAEIVGSRGTWRSPSAVGSGLNLAAEPKPGERRSSLPTCSNQKLAKQCRRNSSLGGSGMPCLDMRWRSHW